MPPQQDRGNSDATTAESMTWWEIFASMPVPTLLITIETPTELSTALVVAANDSAQDLLPSTEPARHRLSSIVDGDSLDRIAEAASHLFTEQADISLKVDIRTIAQGEGAPAGLQTMYLRGHGADQLIAQIPPNEHANDVEQVLEQQRRFRSALLELTELAHSTQNDEVFYHRLIERAVEVVPGAQGGSVQLHIEGTDAFRFVAAVGYDLAGLQLHNFDKSEFFRDAHDPEAQIVRDMMRGKSSEIHDWLQKYGRVDEIVVNVSSPIIVDGHTVAFLSLDNFEDPNALDQTSVEMTTVIGHLIGDLWRRRQLESQLRRERETFRHEALHDSLTSLSNRRDLEQRMSEMVQQDQRAGRASAVMFVDIDDFKLVNDALGHDGGDAILCAVADGLAKVVGASGVVGRWGGDEFMILPDRLRSLDAVEALAERILEHSMVDLRQNRTVELTVGIGWCPDNSATPRELRTAADEALYEAKNAGKRTARTRVLGGAENSSNAA